jgi:transposase
VHTTYQIAESYRDENGKIRQRILLHLGPADKFFEKDIDTLINGLLKAKGLTLEALDSDIDNVKAFGHIWALMHLWKELKISQSIARARGKSKIEFDLDHHIKSLVFNRLDDPSSKLRLLTWLEVVYIPGIKREDIRYEYLLRAMDFLIAHKREIEDGISHQMLNLFNRELKLCFYDLTSSYFEAESSLIEGDIRRLGYSRDHRPDREQIVIGVVMSGDGIPLAHYTFPGNTSDRSTLQMVVGDIVRRFGVDRVTLVADKGMVSGANLRFLVETGQDFILGESARQSKTAREVISEAAAQRQSVSPRSESYIYETQKDKISRITQVGDNGEPQTSTYRVGLRYVACYNGKMALKKYQTRTRRISDALGEIERLERKEISIEECYSQIKGLLELKGLNRFFRVELSGKAVLVNKNDEELAYEALCDGWFLIITKNQKLYKEKIVERYKDLKYVEHGFFELKHSLELRPNFHWTEKRIKAHVLVCFLAFQMAVLFERRLGGLQLTWERAMEKLKRIQVIEWEGKNRERKGLVRTKPEQLEIFQAIGSPKPTMAAL